MEAVRHRKQAEYTDVGDRTRTENWIRKQQTDTSRSMKEDSNRPTVSTRYVYYSQVEALVYFLVGRVVASLIRI
jgi:hypothetical protein